MNSVQIFTWSKHKGRKHFTDIFYQLYYNRHLWMQVGTSVQRKGYCATVLYVRTAAVAVPRQLKNSTVSLKKQYCRQSRELSEYPPLQNINFLPARTARAISQKHKREIKRILPGTL